MKQNRWIALLGMVLVLCLLTVGAQAATVKRDGLDITLSADKKAYEKGEEISLSLTVENTGSNSVQVLSVDYETPENTVVHGMEADENAVLEPSDVYAESASFAVVAPPEELPQTGDDAQPWLWLLLLAGSAACLLCLKPETRKRLMVLVLCITLLSSLLPQNVSIARAETDEDTLEEVFDPETEVVLMQDGAEEEDHFMQLCQTLMERSAGFASDAPAQNRAVEEYVVDKESVQPIKVPLDILQPKANAIPQGVQTVTVSETVVAGAETIRLSAVVSYEFVSSGEEVVAADAEWRYSKIVNMIGKSLIETFGFSSTYIAHLAYHGTSSTLLPGSQHPYPNGVDYLYCIAGGKGVTSMTLFFSNLCLLENGWDGIIIYDSDGEYVGSYTSNTLAGKSLTVKGNGVFIRLITDGSYGMHGFSLDRVIANRTPSISSCSLNSSSKPVIKWTKMYGYTGYRIQRATISSKGKVGSYKTIATVSSSSATSFTDTSAKTGKAYAYRILQSFAYGSTKKNSPYSSAVKTYTVGKTSLTSGKAKISNSKPKVTLKWKSVSKATKYAIYRCDTKNGTYQKIATTTSTSYTTTLPDRNYYYFKIRAYTKFNGVQYSGPLSSAKKYGLSPLPSLNAPQNVTTKVTSKGLAYVKWNKVDKATGYQVYYKAKGSSSWTKYGTTKSNSITLSKLPNKVTSASVRVRAYYTSSDGQTKYGSYCSPVTVNPVTVRSLYVIEENYANNAASARNCYHLDAPRLKNIFKTATPYGRPVLETYCYKDRSKSQLLSLISTMASKADSNDVTIFSLGTHGASGITSGPYAGWLILSDGNWLTFGELATALKRIPGRVVIIIQSCGSGSSIARSDSIDYTADVIEAFANEDELLELEEVIVSDGEEIEADTGELRVSNKFYVIASSQGGENSWRSSLYGSFLYYWIECGLWAADSNNNKTITLSEMEKYLQKRGRTETFNGVYHMIPQVYPSGSSFPLLVD